MTEAPSNIMWGGVFDTAPSSLMQEINASIEVDKRLYAEDIAGSVAHAEMLAAQGIISATDKDAIIKGLAQIKSEIERGEFTYTPELEDIHMHVEARLKAIIGEAAGRLHTARSRNDQVATDMRLWVKKALSLMDAELKDLQNALIARAEEHVDTVMPGFTHLQTAQPVTLGHHMLAYVEMFGRDRLRAQDAISHMDECPLGSAALAGTSYPIDRHATAKALGFARPTANSLDGVAARDFVLELLSVASICATHMSRLAEELILWSSPQFAFITLSDEFSTGSSIMPQKRNPDAAELVRGKSGRIIGNLVGMLATMKALPLAYNKDMQEDKAPSFETIDALVLCLRCLKGMVGDMQVHGHAMAEAASFGYANATDLADWLVQKLGKPFREAHHITGAIVKLAMHEGLALEELALIQLQEVEAGITDDVFRVLGVNESVDSRVSHGGTAPKRVKEALTQAKARWL